jgi:hypothetical protein
MVNLLFEKKLGNNLKKFILDPTNILKKQSDKEGKKSLLSLYR